MSLDFGKNINTHVPRNGHGNETGTPTLIYGELGTKPNISRAIQISPPGSKVPHWSCFPILALPRSPVRNRTRGIRDGVKRPTRKVC